MKSPLSLFLFMTISLASYGQGQPGAVAESTETIIPETDVDSVEQKLQHLPDSLLPSYHRVDSIRTDFIIAADSLQDEYETTIANIDDQLNGLNTAVDSLTRLKLPVERHTRRLDSLRQLRQDVEAKFSSKLNDLKAKTAQKLNNLDLPSQYKKPVEELTQKVNRADINTKIPDIPNVNIPGYSKPALNGTVDLPGKVGEVTGIEGAANIPTIQTPAGNLSNIANGVKGYESDVKNIADGNVSDVEKLPGTLEQQASKVEGIDELQKSSGAIDEHKAKLEELNELNDPSKAKEKVATEARKAAVNHFAGKEEQLKSAMEKISKYKQKYSSVSSIKDLPKRPPNAMKGKPLIERLVPGLSLQYQQKNSYLIDVNPYVGYKLSGRLITGLGWNERYAFGNSMHSSGARLRIFGPRAYVDFKIGKGFIAHVETESMNSFVPSTLHGNPDSGNREWVWSCMTGIKKEYKIYKNLKGTALIQYNIFNRYYKAPYVDRLNSRIGFEYVLKKGKNKSKRTASKSG